MTIKILTPAKINLGLEVLRKRNDGYHDIATVFQTVSIFDRIRVQPSASNDVRMIGAAIEIEANLAERALEMATGQCSSAYQFTIEKRIPVAAGLGGASADAAAVLRALEWFGEPFPEPIQQMALQLGSDVPFLVRGGAAFATGRGEILEPVSSLRGCWIVLATPSAKLDGKTARLYGALTPGDYSDGSRALKVAEALRSGTLPHPAGLSNVFLRPMTELLPDVSASIFDDFKAAGAPFVALSGAGPTHYTIVETLQEARKISAYLASRTSIPVSVCVARPVSTGMQIRGEKTRDLPAAL